MILPQSSLAFGNWSLGKHRWKAYDMVVIVNSIEVIGNARPGNIIATTYPFNRETIALTMDSD